MSIRTIYLAGAGGSGNIGGEAILLAIIKILQERYRDPRFIISAWGPERVREVLAPIRAEVAAVRKEGGGIYWRDLREADLFVVCGDIALSENVVPFLPAYWSLRALTARLAKTPAVLFGVEAETLRRPTNRLLVRRVLGPATHAVIARNGRSTINLRELGLPESSIHLGAEPSLVLTPDDWEGFPPVEPPGLSSGPVVGFGLKDFYDQPFRFDLMSRRLVRRDARLGEVGPAMRQVIEFTARLADHLIETFGAQVVFIPHHGLTGSEKVIKSDAEVARLVIARQRRPEGSLILEENLHPFQVIRFYRRPSLVFSMRHHANSFALLQGVPTFGYRLSEKIVNFFEHLGRPEMLLDPLAPDWERLTARIEWTLAYREEISRELHERRRAMVEDLYRAVGDALP